MKIVYPILILFLFFQNSFGITLHVGSAFAYSSIATALTSSHDGDTIFVHGGLYKEGNIIIDKSISLIGVDKPVLDGQKQYEVLSIKANHVLVTGFHIQHCGRASLNDPCGIKVYDSHHVNLIGNDLSDNYFGIYLQYSRNCIIRENKIIGPQTDDTQTGNGIHCWKSDSLQIIANAISGHRDGIYFEFVKNSIIWRNISYDNIRYGLHFMFSNDDSYITNLFRNNGAGVAVMFTHNVRMFNNTFMNNWGDAAYGLLLKEISDSYIFNNRFTNNTTGIFMEGTNRIVLEKNILKDNGWGMKIQASCMDNRIIENNFINNTFDISTNGSLVLNTFDHNYWDEYEGYDLDKNRIGDIPFRPLSLFSVLVEQNPPTMLLYRSFIVTLLDRAEKIIPTLTPDNFIDNAPSMHPIPL
jgi:nitrous oxidase accessory protein